MRVMITGVDGYLGWTLAIHLAARGHEVAGIDDYSRRRWVGEMGSQSAIPIAPMAERLTAYRPGCDRNRGLGAHLADPAPSRVVVDAGDLVTASGQVNGERPAEIAVDAGDHHSH